MKKLLALVLALTLVLALAACGGAPASEAPVEESVAEPAEEPVSEPVEEEPAIGDYADKTIGIAHYSTADEGAYAYAKIAQEYLDELGINYVFLDANNDAQTQANHFEDLMSQGVDAILTVPVDAAALSDTIIACNEAGIPVAMMDRSTEAGEFLCLVQSDNVAHGYAAGEALVEMAEEQGLALEDIKALELQGDLASSAGKERSEGYQSAAADLGFEIVQSLPTYWNTDTAYNCVLDGLQANPDANAIFLPSDNVCAEATVSALEQLDRLVKAGEEGHIIITTVDGGPAVYGIIRDGYIDAVAAQQIHSMPIQAIDYILRFFDGEITATEGIIEEMPPVMGYASNVDEADPW